MRRIAAVAAILRIDQLHEALGGGDLRRAVLVAARAETADERVALASAMFDQSSPENVATALAEVVRGEQRGAWPAVQAVAGAVVAAREQYPERFAPFFSTLID